MHIDEWIDSPFCENDGEKYAKFMFWYFRYPAWARDSFKQWMDNHKLFCTYNQKRYRCIGASRMGDIWLTTNYKQDVGYELRVDVIGCSEWGEKP